jgi:hypothetical protein
LILFLIPPEAAFPIETLYSNLDTAWLVEPSTLGKAELLLEHRSFWFFNVNATFPSMERCKHWELRIQLTIYDDS